MTQQQSALRVSRVEETFDRHAVRRVLAQEGHETVVDCPKSIGDARMSGGRERSAGHQSMPGSVCVNAAVTGAHGTGIDPENPHAREASISFSSMSTFDQTFLVSSCSSSASISLSIC